MSNSSPSDQPTSEGSNFTSDGPQTGTATGPALQPEGGWLAINGSTDLSSCIAGYSSAAVSHIYVSNQPPEDDPITRYQYCVWVYGQGPSGFGSGKFELTFTDQTGSNYSVSLYSSDLEWHFVDFNSDSPGITEVTWYSLKGDGVTVIPNPG